MRGVKIEELKAFGCVGGRSKKGHIMAEEEKKKKRSDLLHQCLGMTVVC